MAGFDAGRAVEGLEVTFKPYASFDGKIKEPSDKQIGAFLEGMRSVVKDATKGSGLEDVDTSDPVEMLRALDNLDVGMFTRLHESIAGAYSELCSGKPTSEQIMALPLRVRAKFYGWIQSEVVSPEAGSGGGAQVVTLPPRAAGG